MQRLSFLILLLLPVLIGCSPSFRSAESNCIKTSFVSSLSRIPLSHFIKGDNRMVTVSAFKAGCGGTSPDLPGGYDDIGINVTLAVPHAPSPKGVSKEITVPLFVALLDRQNNILDRQDEALALKVGDNAHSQAYKITYHPPEGIDPTSVNHKILVGFNEGAIKGTPSSSVKKKPLLKKHHIYNQKPCKQKKSYKSLKNKMVKKRTPKLYKRAKTKKAKRWHQQY